MSTPQQPWYVHVRAKAGSKKETVEQTGTNKWVVCVRQKAEKGAANERIAELVALELGVSVSALRLIKGATSPSKVYLVGNHSVL